MKSNKKNLKQRWRKWRTKINLLTTSIVPRSSAHGRVSRHFGGTPKRANSWEERVAVGVSSSCPLTICHVKTSPCQNVIRFFYHVEIASWEKKFILLLNSVAVVDFWRPSRFTSLHSLSHSLSHSMRNNFEERKDMSTLCKFYVGSEKRLVLDHVSTQAKLSSSHKKAK